MSFDGGHVGVDSLSPGDTLHMHLLSDPTQAGYYDLQQVSDLDLRNQKSLNGFINSLDQTNQQIVMQRFQHPYIVMTATKKTKIYKKNGKVGNFSDLTIGAPIAISGVLDTKTNSMARTDTVRVLKNS